MKKQVMKMPEQPIYEEPKQAVKIKPIEIKEAADVITPRIRNTKTQLLGFFDTGDDDLY